MKNATLPNSPATALDAGQQVGSHLDHDRTGGRRGSYLLETPRTEQAALDRATTGAATSSRRLQMAFDGKTQEEHGTLNRLLDRTRFVGIRYSVRVGR